MLPELKNPSRGTNAAESDEQQKLQQALDLYRQGLFEQAQALCDEILRKHADDSGALYLSGLLACETGQLQRAGELLGKALKINPHHAEAWNGQGLVLNKLGQHKFALLNFDRAIALKPDYAEAYCSRGNSLSQLKQYEAAVQDYDRAISLKPDYAEAYHFRGYALRQLKQYQAAIQSIERAIALKPDYADAYNSLGCDLTLHGKHEAAMACYERAISIKPDHAVAHYNKAFMLLHRHDFEAGWREYEWRWEGGGNPNPKKLETDKPLWTGEESEQRLLIWSEQALGEQLLFGSLLREAARLPGKTIARINPRLVPVFSRSIAGIEFQGNDTPLDSGVFDEQISMGGLAGLLRPTIAEFGNNAASFLKCDEALRDELRQKIRKPGRQICGLSWFSQNTPHGEAKSLNLEQLLPLLRNKDIDFVDLQYGDTQNEREQIEAEHGIRITKLGEIDNTNDLDSLAALVSACDFVITTSNVTAHLAGALGQKTLLLAPFGMQKFWYWSNIEGKSTWYPSIRVFEQHEPGDWSGCVGAVRQYLELEL